MSLIRATQAAAVWQPTTFRYRSAPAEHPATRRRANRNDSHLLVRDDGTPFARRPLARATFRPGRWAARRERPATPPGSWASRRRRPRADAQRRRGTPAS